MFHPNGGALSHHSDESRRDDRWKMRKNVEEKKKERTFLDIFYLITKTLIYIIKIWGMRGCL